MKELQVKVSNPNGLHARPSAHFASIAKKFDCRISVTKDDRAADGRSIMGLLTLAASCGTVLNICLVGPEAEQAAQALLQECKEYIVVFEQNPI